MKENFWMKIKLSKTFHNDFIMKNDIIFWWSRELIMEPLFILIIIKYVNELFYADIFHELC